MIVYYVSAIIVFVLTALAIWYRTRDTRLVKIKRGVVTDFSAALNLCGLPIITLYQGKNKFNFIVDTGANVSYLHCYSNVAITEEIPGYTTLFGSTGRERSCDIRKATLYLNDYAITADFRSTNLTDVITYIRSYFGITICGQIGNDILCKYGYCIDYKEKVIYRRK